MILLHADRPGSTSLHAAAGAVSLQTGYAIISRGGPPGGSCAWPEPEGDESPRLAGKPLIPGGIDGGGPGHRARFG